MADLKAEILKYVQERDHVSFAELSRDIQGFKGEFEMLFPRFRNLIIWQGVSRVTIDAINSLLNDKSLFLTPATPLVYLIDGIALTLPIAKRARDYTKPHWVPVVLTQKNPNVVANSKKKR